MVIWDDASRWKNRRKTGGLSDRAYIHYYSMPEPNSGCWLWLGAVDKYGYGSGRKRDGVRKAYQLSYIAFKDMIPKGMVVRHTCDTPGCVNPDHLILGTQQENNKDKYDRQRHYRGENHHWARIDDERVAKIRLASGTHASIAKQFGVGQSTVTRIKNGRRRACP
jgi:hypothetical protein